MAQSDVVIQVKTKGQRELERLHQSLNDAGSASGKLQGETKKLDAAVKQTQGSFDGLTGKTTKAGREIRKAANGMEYFIDAAGKARKVNGQFVTTTEAAAAGLKRQGDAAQAAGGGISKLAGAVKSLVAAYAGIQAIKFVFGKTAELQTQTRSLEVLTQSAEKARNIVKELQDFGNVTPFTSSELIDTAKRLKAFGVDTEKLVDTTKRLGDVAGATGADLDGIATAYGQIQAKGRLQGEELLQLQERGIDLQGELQKMYGLTGEEFRKALEKGRFSSEAVEVALTRLTDVGGKYANGAIAQSDTLAGRLSTLQDNIQRLAQNVGRILTPLFDWVIQRSIEAVNAINSMFGRWQQEDLVGQDRKNQLLQQAARDAEKKFGRFSLSKEKETFRNRQYEAYLQNAAVKNGFQAPPTKTQVEVKVEPFKIPELLGASSGTTGTGTGSGAGGAGGAGGTTAKSFKPSSRAQALIAAAKKLGVSPLDLATIISYETAGTFSPSIMGGAGGNYQGLIQFGPTERRQYGAHGGQSFEEQVMGPVVRFFEDRFRGVGRSTQGASLLDLYKTVNGGNPNVSAGLSDGNGTIGGHVQKMMGGHRQKALATFFGGSQENTGYSSTDSASDIAAGWDQVAQKVEQAQQALARFSQGMAGSNDQLKAQLADLNEVNRLIMEGMDPSVAQEQVSAQRSLLDIEAQRREKLAELQGLVGEHLVEAEEQKRLEEEINALFNERKSLQGELNAARAQATELASADKTSAAQQQIQSDAQGLASTLSGGLKNALVTAIKGGDVGAAFQQIAEQMGQKFLDIAFRHIEQALESMFTGFLQGLNPQQIAAQQNMTAGQTMMQASMNFLNAASMMQSMGGGGGGGGLGGLFG